MALTDLPRRVLAVPRPAWLSSPSWARAWRARSAVQDGRDGPRVAVIGNCQARELAQAVRLLAPRARVQYVSLSLMRRDYGDMDGLLRFVAGCDHVFAQSFPAGLIPGGDITTLRTRETRLRLFPVVVFSAFHPDVVYAGRTDDLATQKLSPSPMGLYHSAIALCAYRLGLPAPRAARLFRESVFGALGYLDQWRPATQELLGLGASIGFGLDREMSAWARRGTFMHVLNHPKAFVVGDIARRLMGENGLDAQPVRVEDYLGDDLARDVVWPVYPAVADLYGVPGSTLFKARPRGAAFPRLYDLDGFLAESFAIYDRLDPAALACPRVDTWLAAPWIREVFLDG